VPHYVRYQEKPNQGVDDHNGGGDYDRFTENDSH
jgi:hypothetical protein